MVDLLTTFTRFFFRDFDVEWRWPSNVPENAWDRIEFESGGGELVGVFGGADGDPSAVVVLAHPQKVSAKGFFLRSDLPGALREAGYDVFAFDFNGFGESERGTVQYHVDVQNAIDTAESVSDAPGVAVLGASMGGAFLVPALAESDGSVDAVIFDSVYPTTRDLLWRRNRFQWAGLRVGEFFRPDGTRAMSPIKYADAVHSPDELLFIYGEDDSFIPAERRREFITAFPHDDEDVDVWIAPETDHVYPMITHQQRYVDTVCEYLDDRCGAGG